MIQRRGAFVEHLMSHVLSSHTHTLSISLVSLRLTSHSGTLPLSRDHARAPGDEITRTPILSGFNYESVCVRTPRWFWPIRGPVRSHRQEGSRFRPVQHVDVYFAYFQVFTVTKRLHYTISGLGNTVNSCSELKFLFLISYPTKKDSVKTLEH